MKRKEIGCCYSSTTDTPRSCYLSHNRLTIIIISQSLCFSVFLTLCKYFVFQILKRKVGRLQKLARGQQDPEASFSRNEEYFYERAPALFHVVYQFYLSGSFALNLFKACKFVGLIHQPGHLCPQDILDELRFWQIPIEPFLAPCCCYEQPDEQNGDDSSANVEKPNLFKNLCCGKLRRAVWDILEEPTR